MKVDFIHELAVCEKQVNDYINDSRFTEAFKPADLNQAVFAYIKRVGKRLRPAVMMWSCGACGGNPEKVLPAAAAVEMFHTWTLVHDDLIDNDDTRRGGPAVHKLGEILAKKNFNYTNEQAKDYGRDLAILAGDLQHSLNVKLMCECYLINGIKPEVVLNVLHLLESDVVNTLIEGEMLDIQYSKMPVEKLNYDDIIRMLWMKTGALLEFSAKAGAMLALEIIDASDKIVTSLANFASSCGTAFQLQDDILGLIADEEKLGKPVGSDIKEGKKTTIVYFALEKADDNQKKLILNTLGNRESSDNDIEKVKKIFISLGALDRTTELIKCKINEALLQLDILPESKYKELLKAWADFIISRSH